MNINELPSPPIKPTKLPSIVKDQHKEAQFAAGQTLTSSAFQHNPNAEPNKGGLLSNIAKYLEAQQQASQANARKLSSTAVKSSSSLPNRKKGSPGWVVAFIVVWIGFGIVSSIVENVRVADDTPPSFSTSEAPATTEYVTQTTDCLEVTIPEGSWFLNSGLNDCEVSFDGGYSLSRRNIASFDGSPFYDDVDDYLFSRGIFNATPVTINGVEAQIVEDTSATSGVSEYLFWIRDLGVVDGDGEPIDSVSFYLYENGFDSQQAADIVLSVKFVAAQ